jgi:hypothetical protein
MIEVEPREDELSLGHECRIAWLNNCKSILELTSLISRTLVEKGYQVSSRTSAKRPRYNRKSLFH